MLKPQIPKAIYHCLVGMKTSIEVHWVIPSFLEDNLSNKSFDWESFPHSEEPPYTACGEPEDLLSINLDLKHIPMLGTCRGDFATMDVVFKYYTYVSKGWRSWCRRVLMDPSFVDINKDIEGLLSLLYRWNSTTHTFFIGFQEVSPSLEDVFEILRLLLFIEGDMVNIPLSSEETKFVKFLEVTVKKTLKKPILKVARKGKAPNEEAMDDTNVSGDKGSKTNF